MRLPTEAMTPRRNGCCLRLRCSNRKQDLCGTGFSDCLKFARQIRDARRTTTTEIPEAFPFSSILGVGSEDRFSKSWFIRRVPKGSDGGSNRVSATNGGRAGAVPVEAL